MAGHNKKLLQTQTDLSLLNKGLVDLLADGSTLQLAGKPMTKAELLAKLAAWSADFDQVHAMEAALAQARGTRAVSADSASAFIGLLKPMLLGMFGNTEPKLALCGVYPKKQAAPLSVEAQVRRNARNQATRKARGTMGKRQKAAIHGTVPTPPAMPVDGNGGTSH